METEDFVVFNDLHPKSTTHLLIVPKIHVPTLNEFKPSGKVFELIQQLAGMLEQPEYKIQVNVGSSGGQEVFHLHFHMVSSFKLKSIA